jgi:phosphatidylglycerophosphatase A
MLAPSLTRMLAAPHQLVAMVFGLGLSRFWPGTLGTIAGFGLYAALLPLPPLWRAGVFVVLIALGSWASQRTGEDLGKQDHNSIVVDETIGMALVLQFVTPDLAAFVAAFLLFRLFDVLKPWPVYLAHRDFEGGFFVVLDDVLAAIYAGLATRYLVMPLLA